MRNTLLAAFLIGNAMTALAQGPDFSNVDSKEKVQALAGRESYRRSTFSRLSWAGTTLKRTRSMCHLRLQR